MKMTLIFILMRLYKCTIYSYRKSKSAPYHLRALLIVLTAITQRRWFFSCKVTAHVWKRSKLHWSYIITMNESSRCRQLISLCQLEFLVPRIWLLAVLYKYDISIRHYLLICVLTSMWRHYTLIVTGEGGVGVCAWNENRGEAYTEYHYVPVTPSPLPQFEFA